MAALGELSEYGNHGKVWDADLIHGKLPDADLGEDEEDDGFVAEASGKVASWNVDAAVFQPQDIKDSMLAKFEYEVRAAARGGKKVFPTGALDRKEHKSAPAFDGEEHKSAPAVSATQLEAGGRGTACDISGKAAADFGSGSSEQVTNHGKVARKGGKKTTGAEGTRSDDAVTNGAALFPGAADVTSGLEDFGSGLFGAQEQHEGEAPWPAQIVKALKASIDAATAGGQLEANHQVSDLHFEVMVKEARLGILVPSCVAEVAAVSTMLALGY